MALTSRTPQQIADKWARNLGASTDDIRAGVMAVREAPGAVAARMKDKYLRRVQESVDKWAARTSAVTLAQWQQAMISKALPIIGSRAETAKPKFRAFMQEWMQYQAQVAQVLSSMPRGTLDQNIQRCNTVIRMNYEWPRGGGAATYLSNLAGGAMAFGN